MGVVKRSTEVLGDAAGWLAIDGGGLGEGLVRLLDAGRSLTGDGVLQLLKLSIVRLIKHVIEYAIAAFIAKWR